MCENKKGYSIEIKELGKNHGSLTVFHDFNITIEAGDFVAIVGPSGSGKSTLLRMISGLDSFSSGSIKIDGKEIAGVNKGVRVVFQEAALIPWRNIIKNVIFGTIDKNEATAAQILEKAGLINKKYAWPNALTDGEKQRVSLARALAGKPNILLLDDPLGTLDALTKMEIQGLIEKLWLELGFTAVLVTRDVSEAVRLANRVILLEKNNSNMDLQITLSRPRIKDNDAGYFEQYILNKLTEDKNAGEEAKRLEYTI